MNQKRTPKTSWTKDEILEEAKKFSTRGEFAMGNRSAYKKAHREGWLDEICNSMVRPSKPKGYWTKERVIEVAKSYTSKSDFSNSAPIAYRVALSNGWMRELYHFFEKKQPYTREECRLEASKYNSKEDFMKESPSYYNCAKNYRILTEIYSHMGANTNSRYIYVVEFEDHYAYIGITCSPQRRYKQLLTDKKSTVYKHIKESGIKHIFKVLTDGTIEDVVQQEILWIKYYKDDGWLLLNRKFDDAICKHMDKDIQKVQHWTKERCIEEAKKYKTRKSFQKECRGGYAAAYRNKWLDEICSHMERPNPHNSYWTIEKCHEEALKYTTRKDFQKDSCGAYNAAKRMGVLDTVCAHMPRISKPAGYWTKARCIREAKKNKSISGLRKNSPSAFNIAWRNGWINEIRDLLK